MSEKRQPESAPNSLFQTLNVFRTVIICWMSWIAVALCFFVVGCIASNLGIRYGGGLFYSRKGWPLYFEYIKSTHTYIQEIGIYPAYLIVDVIVMLVGIAGCIYCVLRLNAWKEPKFSLRVLFQITALSCILLSLLPNEQLLYKIIDILCGGNSFVNESLYRAGIFLRLVYLTILACSLWMSFGLIQFMLRWARSIDQKLEGPAKS